MTAAVIISTYNSPSRLEKVLWGYAAQDTRAFDVVIADDGSGKETWRVIDSARPWFGERLRHVWHEDRGFRKCEILNHAIRATDADYIIFTDGDCIPRRDFVSVHTALAERNRFLSGGAIWLPRPLSVRITRGDIDTGRLGRADWLRAQGWPGGRDRLRLVSRPLAAALDALTPTRPTFNGHNASVPRTALLAVNGFDADMGYGGLDRALGERLENLGLRGKQVRYRAVCFHLDHDRPYRSVEVIRRNRALRARIRREGLVRARLGIEEGVSESVVWRPT